jgi:hypothetical protein
LVTDQPKSLTQHRAVKHRAFCGKPDMKPFLKGRVLAMTHPQGPKHPKQADGLTAIVIKLKARYFDQGTKSEQRDVNEEDPK